MKIQSTHLIVLWGSLLTAGCQSTVPATLNLTQSALRPVATSLRLPAERLLGPVVPGLAEGAVPQGLTRTADAEWIYTSHYFDDGRPSCLVAMDPATGIATSTFYLLEPDGTPHGGHVGGIACDDTHLWIASDALLYRGLLSELMHDPSAGTFRPEESFSTEATHEAAFCSVYNNHIWVGEFALDDRYPTDPAHHMTAPDGDTRTGWICGYDPRIGFDHPEHVLSIPDRAQGMYATDDHILLSRSYSRRNRSALEIHRNPLSEPPHRVAETSTGRAVPLWFLDSHTLVRSIDLPPMAENVTGLDRGLGILFESGATKFRLLGKGPLDHVVLLPLAEVHP